MSTQPPYPPQGPPPGTPPPPPPPPPGSWQPQQPGAYGPATPYGGGYPPLAAAQLSGFWRRFLAYLIDAILLGVVGGVIQSVIAAIIRASGDVTGVELRSGLIGLILGLAYFGYLWSRNGQSLGYMVMGIRLVRADGAPVTAGLAVLRYFLIYVSFALCLIPAIVSAFMIGLSQRKQGIHDLINGTLVVRA
jgi:uncharacterized RDD family membrane protein YckC